MPARLPHTPLPLDIISRCLAALAGGYALSIALPLLLALLLAVDRAQATLVALLFSFTVYTAAFLWTFCARTHWRAWIGLLLPALGCGAIDALILSLRAGGQV